MAEFRYQGFCLPKAGNSPEEVEDAFAVNLALRRFAVSDGASESAFAGAWARALVEGNVGKKGTGSEWLHAARRQWHDRIAGQELPWYVETKFQEGAFATLLTLKISRPAGEENNERRWAAAAVGDSCLFHIRDDKLVESFPIGNSLQFSNSPELLCSRIITGGRRKPRRQQITGTFQLGDQLFLTTDSVAQWFLSRWEQREKPWRQLARLEDEAAFARWLAIARERKEIRNDDVTLLLVEAAAPMD